MRVSSVQTVSRSLRDMIREETYVGLDIQVLQVERVLPDVNADHRRMGQKRVLVRGRDDFKTLRRRVYAL